MSPRLASLLLACLLSLAPACRLFAADEPARRDAHGDPLPPGALLRLGTVRWRACTRSLAFTPDGKTLVVGDYGTQGLMRCWDTATGKETANFTVPGGQLPFALSPDGKTLAVDATQKLHAVLFVSVPGGKEVRRIDVTSTVPGGNLYFDRFDFSPDGRMLAAVGNDSVCRLLDVETGKTVLHLTGEAGGRFPTAFSPDGKDIALVGEQNTLRVVEIATEKELFRRQAPKGESGELNMSFSPDGKTLAWVGEAKNIFALWDIASGKAVRQFRGPSETVEAVHFSPDGKRIGAAYVDNELPSAGVGGVGLVRIWDAESGKELRKLVAPSGAVDSFVFSPDGKRMAAGYDWDGVVHLWDVETGRELSRTGEHQSLVCSVAFAPDGRTAFTGCADQVVRQWDADKGTVTRRIEVGGGGSPGTYDVCFSGDRKTAAFLWPRGGGEVWNLEAGSRLARLDEEGAAFETHFSPDGKSVAARGMFDNLRLWDAKTGKKESPILLDSNGLGSFAFSPDGKTLMAERDVNPPGGGEAMEVSLWDTASGNVVRKWSPPNQGMHCLQFSPDGRTVAAAASDRVDLWDAATGRELYPLLTPKDAPGWLWCPTFSADGKTLAAGSISGAVYLWEVRTGKPRAVFVGHRNRVASLDFSPDGARLLSGSHDTTALIWDLTGLAAAAKPAKPLTPADLLSLWDDLADADAGKAWRAGWRLASDPAASVPFLRERLRPAEVDAAAVAKAAAALDGDDFDEREAATRRLAAFGDLAGPALRAALDGKPSDEARRRLEELVRLLDEPVRQPEKARALRCVEVLEHVGSAEARGLLDDLGRGAPGAAQTRDAKAALARRSKSALPAP